jgi:hypothetical protein
MVDRPNCVAGARHPYCRAVRQLTPDPGAHFFGEDNQLVRCTASHDNCELIAAEPSHDSFREQLVRNFEKYRGHVPQYSIAGLVAVMVVDIFQAVDVAHDEPDGGAL